jgi:hypothetical protein
MKENAIQSAEMILALLEIVGKLRVRLIENGVHAVLTPMEEAFLRHADKVATFQLKGLI